MACRVQLSPDMLRLIPLALISLSVADRPAPPTAATEPVCVRLVGEQIGQLPLAVHVGAQRVEFLQWKAMDVTATTLIGFTAQASDQVRFTVEAGGRIFSAGPNWLHPTGVVGPQVAAITALTLCER